MDGPTTESDDLLAIARERVKLGPVPEWVVACSYDEAFHPKLRGRLTPLLIESQIHTEIRQTFLRSVLRLETIEAVTQWSQWRVEFEPQTQALTLHTVRIRRGSAEVEHASLERLQYLRREAGLEGCVISGWITLLLVLEDVRPGDIIETAYTIENHPRLFSENATAFFTLPAGTHIGKYHFAVRHSSDRKVNWKSSSADLSPSCTKDEKECRLVWLGESKAIPEIEGFVPIHHIPFEWIQISDCADWQAVARGVHDAWTESPVEDGFKKLLEEIQSATADLESRLNRVIELVQDEFRYLSVNLELGGQIPAPAEYVLRRRYGDCKDLAFLLVRVLRAMGVSAWPVLVHADWRRSIARMLPSPNVFNHVVVEFELNNEKRWVDCTRKCQGGGALGKWVSDFGFGLRIDPATTDLVPVPKSCLPTGVCDIKEAFILDTAGNPSYLAVNLTLTGVYADEVRLQLASEGFDIFSKKRLQICANRYSKAARIGVLEYRDERLANQFLLGEVFEIAGFLQRDARDNSFLFQLHSDSTAGFLVRPSVAPRRNPFALPFPCNRVHTIEIDLQALTPVSIPLVQTSNNYFRFNRRGKSLQKFFRVSFALDTLRPEVPPDQLSEYRRLVDEVWPATSMRLRLPPGYARMRKRDSFGALPPPSRPAPPGTVLRQMEHAPSTGSTVGPPTPSPPSPAPQLEAAQAQALDESRIGSPVEITPAEKKVFINPAAPTATVEPAGTHRVRRRSGDSYHHTPRLGKSSLALITFIGTVATFAIAFAAGRSPAGLGIAGLLYLFVIPAVPLYIVLAILGLSESSRLPGRYPYASVCSSVTLLFGTIFSLILTAAVANGVRYVIAGAEARSSLRRAQREPLKFEQFNFVYHPPGPPWRQIDARGLGRYAALALASPRARFSIAVHPIEPGNKDPRARALEMYMASAKEFTFVQYLSEKPVSRNGVEGLQIEFQANIQGHDFYGVSWLVVSNGYAYFLSCSGRPDDKDQILSGADAVFSSFELTK